MQSIFGSKTPDERKTRNHCSKFFSANFRSQYKYVILSEEFCLNLTDPSRVVTNVLSNQRICRYLMWNAFTSRLFCRSLSSQVLYLWNVSEDDSATHRRRQTKRRSDGKPCNTWTRLTGRVRHPDFRSTTRPAMTPMWFSYRAEHFSISVTKCPVVVRIRTTRVNRSNQRPSNGSSLPTNWRKCVTRDKWFVRTTSKSWSWRITSNAVVLQSIRRPMRSCNQIFSSIV